MAEKKKIASEPKSQFAFNATNFKLLAIGVAIVVVGYSLMVGGGSEDPNVFNGEELFSFRRITLAPLTVLAGYIFIIYAIMKRPKQQG